MTDLQRYDQLKQQHSELISAVEDMMAKQARFNQSKDQRHKPELWQAEARVKKLINPLKVSQPTLEWLEK